MGNTMEEMERERLKKLVDEFAAEMKKKLLEEFNAGRRGYEWCDPDRKNDMLACLIANAASRDMIDAANFAAFIWNIDK